MRIPLDPRRRPALATRSQDLFFIADILITFRVTFFDAENEMVLDKKKIARAYLNKPSGFALDVAAVFPFELFGFFIGPYHVPLTRLRLFRLIRLEKVAKQIDVHSAVVRVAQMLWLFLIFAHIVGAFWWSLGIADFNRAGMMSTPAGTSWVARYGLDGCLDEHAQAAVASSAATVVDENGTVVAGYNGTSARCSTPTLGIDYWAAMYWAITTLVKTPYAFPDTVGEVAYASTFVVLGAIIFAAILGNVTAMINSFDTSNAQLRDIVTTFQKLIGRYDVPKKLEHRIFTYVQTQWSTSKGINTNIILAKLPQALRGDILEAINSDIVRGCPIFSKISAQSIRLMLSKFKPEVCLSKENLLTPGQICNEVFILVRGVLHVQPADDDGRKSKGSKMKAFRAIEMTGRFVGMRDPFEKEFRYPFHVLAFKQAQTVALSAKDLLEVFIMDNRADIEAICVVLEKEFNDLQTGLMPKDEKRASRVSEHRGSVTGGRRASTKDGALRRSSSALIDSTGKEELHERVGLVEDTVQACQQEIKSIREDLALLPALCDKLGVELADLADP